MQCEGMQEDVVVKDDDGMGVTELWVMRCDGWNHAGREKWVKTRISELVLFLKTNQKSQQGKKLSQDLQASPYQEVV